MNEKSFTATFHFEGYSLDECKNFVRGNVSSSSPIRGENSKVNKDNYEKMKYFVQLLDKLNENGDSSCNFMLQTLDYISEDKLIDMFFNGNNCFDLSLLNNNRVGTQDGFFKSLFKYVFNEIDDKFIRDLVENVSNDSFKEEYIEIIKKLNERKRDKYYYPKKEEMLTWIDSNKNEVTMNDLYCCYSYLVFEDIHSFEPYGSINEFVKKNRPTMLFDKLPFYTDVFFCDFISGKFNSRCLLDKLMNDENDVEILTSV